MDCKLCKSSRVEVIYDGLIRDGGLGKYTDSNVKMYQCADCGVIWHNAGGGIYDLNQYYESTEYRMSLEGTSDEADFYNKHDFESLDKFQYTGTDVYRNRTVADIGCGCGAFLDFIKGVAKECVAVEPSQAYRGVMERKGYDTYAYMQDAMTRWRGKIDLITSFDVIEHVEKPDEFVKDIYELLGQGGKAVIGTPTDAPVMRRLLGNIYEQKLLFSTQHLWILSEKSLRDMSEKAGFQSVKVKYFQRYGVNNLLGWLREKEPRSEIREDDFITPALDAVWRSECGRNGMADYIVIYACKGGGYENSSMGSYEIE